MIRTLYTLVLLTGLVVLSPVFLYRGLRHRKYLGSLRERLGNVPVGRSDRRTLWVHAVSVGELLAAESLVRRMCADFSGWRIVLTTTTSTGQALARERFGDIDVFYFPLDLPWSVRRALESVRPSVVCFVETEIWPNFLAECRRRDVRVAVVNGRISDRSFRGYHRVRRLLAPFLRHVDRWLMQTAADADRIVRLGADTARVEVSGNLKYDVDREEFAARCDSVRPRLEAAFSLPDPRPLVVAGSTADGEEELLARALARVRSRDGLADTRLLVAPRRPERFADVERIFNANGLRTSRRTSPDRPLDADVLLLDSIGELASAYALADVVFVGGSLVPHGGQNILEPAMAGRPVVVGPYTSNFRGVVGDFRDASAVVQLDEAAGPDVAELLADQLVRLLRNPDEARAIGESGLSVIAANRGAVDRTIAALTPIVETAR